MLSTSINRSSDDGVRLIMKNKYTITLNSTQDKDAFITQYNFINFHCGKIIYCDLSDSEFDLIKNDNRVKNIHQSPVFNEPSIPLPEDKKNEDQDFDIQFYNTNNFDKFANLGRITQTSMGKDIDIIIVDSYLAPNSPELLDNNGKQRFIQYNWRDLYWDVYYDQITIDSATNKLTTSTSKYDYEWSKNRNDSWHGTFVAGIAAGNTNGWAKEANVYYIRMPMIGDPDVYFDGTVGWSAWAQYIKAFHRRKLYLAELSKTKANPTIVNCSWSALPIGGPNKSISINHVEYRNTQYYPQTSCSISNAIWPSSYPAASSQCATFENLTHWGFRTTNHPSTSPTIRYTVDDNITSFFSDGRTLDTEIMSADMDAVLSMIEFGIPLIVASGNNSNTIDTILNNDDLVTKLYHKLPFDKYLLNDNVPWAQQWPRTSWDNPDLNRMPLVYDYNNYINMTIDNTTYTKLYTHRGAFPQVQHSTDPNSGAIIVGSCSIRDSVSRFSKVGRGVDIFAPGEQIISQIYPYNTIYPNYIITDPRSAPNLNYYFGSSSGTSFAAPQVAGVLACVFSLYHSKVKINLDGSFNYSDPIFTTYDANQNAILTPIASGIPEILDLPNYGHIAAKLLLLSSYPYNPIRNPILWPQIDSYERESWAIPFADVPTNIVSNGGRCNIPHTICCEDIKTWGLPFNNFIFNAKNFTNTFPGDDNHNWVGDTEPSLRGGSSRMLFNPCIQYLDILPSPNP